ncbi:MAG: response regulator [Campylobacterales bacterium]|nr:response regulator [Campylobacterales bacterium]
MKILIADDESINITILEALLKEYTKEIFEASNGEEALKIFKEKSPQIVITDGIMPIMDGIQLVKEIKKLDQKIPIIFISALDEPDLLARAVQYGIEGFIPKPINRDFFIHSIEKVMKSIHVGKQLEVQERILNQYKLAIDKTTLVSKTDVNGVITYVNEAFERISGYKESELMGKPHSVVRHPDSPDEIFKEMWQTIKAGKNWNGKIKNIRKDGTSYIVDANIFPHKDSNGEIYEFLAIRHDVTQFEEYKDILESQLDDSVSALEDKVNLLHEYEKAINEANGLTRVNLKGEITFTNDTFKKHIGNESLDKKLLKDYLENKYHKKFDQAFEKVLEQKSVNVNVMYSDKKDFYASSTFVPILDVNEKIIEIMGIHQDISDVIELNKEIENTQKEVVFTMGAIGETRSKETGHHVKRVAEYSRFLAIKIGLSEEEAELVKQASPMHDIGKVGIPDAILNKPGKLTDDEYKIMKTHAKLGYNMLKHSNKKILQASAIIAHEHHEKWDGNGYPRRLKGEEIHIYGRITAVADVFDALGHDRVYKKAWPLENILNLFQEERGKHFDPNLVDLFMENLDEILEIKASFGN